MLLKGYRSPHAGSKLYLGLWTNDAVIEMQQTVLNGIYVIREICKNASFGIKSTVKNNRLPK